MVDGIEDGDSMWSGREEGGSEEGEEGMRYD